MINGDFNLHDICYPWSIARRHWLKIKKIYYILDSDNKLSRSIKQPIYLLYSILIISWFQLFYGSNKRWETCLLVCSKASLERRKCEYWWLDLMPPEKQPSFINWSWAKLLRQFPPLVCILPRYILSIRPLAWSLTIKYASILKQAYSYICSWFIESEATILV